MLVEFSVANFRSVHERQTLSLVAAAGQELRDSNVIESPAPATPDLLRAAVIYGANAAGKSNLLLGMQYLWIFVAHSAQHHVAEVMPPMTFAFGDHDLVEQPTEFDVVFVQEGIRYQYGFSVVRERMHSEYLFAWPEGRRQRWFERTWNEKSNTFEWYFGPSLSGPKRIWQEATKNTALLLSIAVQLNAEALLAPFNWINRRLKTVSPFARFGPQFSTQRCGEDPIWRELLVQYLTAADPGIVGIRVEKKNLAQTAPPTEIDSSGQPAMPSAPVDEYDVRFSHRTSGGGEAEIGLDQESGGTQKFFAMAGPWIDVLRNGYILLVDEMDTSLHPVLMKKLLKTFHDPAVNTMGAQLIFTTHDTNMLDSDILRRDQVWFVEKDSLLQSRLYPLTEFSPRKDENIERGYLQGRYGALPFVGELKV